MRARRGWARWGWARVRASTACAAAVSAHVPVVRARLKAFASIFALDRHLRGLLLVCLALLRGRLLRLALLDAQLPLDLRHQVSW